jgi:hypothetical protein
MTSASHRIMGFGVSSIFFELLLIVVAALPGYFGSGSGNTLFVSHHERRKKSERFSFAV